MSFQNRSNRVGINISNMLNGKRCSYGVSVQIAVPFSNKTIYMRDNFLHQIENMALSISCWAIYLTNIDEFIMVTIPVAIMKCHPKIGPWLKWRAEIYPNYCKNFTPWEIHLSSVGSYYSTHYCVCHCWRSFWHPNEFRTSPSRQTFFCNCTLHRFRQGWAALIKTHYIPNLYHKYLLWFLLQYIIRLKWLLVFDTWFLDLGIYWWQTSTYSKYYDTV